MAYYAAKDTLTRKEIVEILRRNIELYKHEPEFSDYIVNLMQYLLDSLPSGQDLPEDEKKQKAPPNKPRAVTPGFNVRGEIADAEDTPIPLYKKTPSAPIKVSPRASANQSTSPKPLAPEGKTRIYKVFRSSTVFDENQYCKICGSETTGQRICPRCGSIV